MKHLRRATLLLTCLSLLALGVACSSPPKPEGSGAAPAPAKSDAAPADSMGSAPAADTTKASGTEQQTNNADQQTSPAQNMGGNTQGGGAMGNDAPPTSGPGSYDNPAMLNPAAANAQAPETFKAKFTTTKGDFTVTATRAWSPLGVDRLYNLIQIGYFKDIAFFRAIGGFMVQFGIHGDPNVNTKWREAKIQDDPKNPAASNKPGYMTFAMAGPNTRTVQFFINFGDNNRLDTMGFTPIAQVTEGMDVVNKLYTGYGEGAPMGSGPNQMLVQTQGNKYLQEKFPELDYIKSVQILP